MVVVGDILEAHAAVHGDRGGELREGVQPDSLVASAACGLDSAFGQLLPETLAASLRADVKAFHFGGSIGPGAEGDTSVEVGVYENQLVIGFEFGQLFFESSEAERGIERSGVFAEKLADCVQLFRFGRPDHGKLVEPIRYSSMDLAALRPSAMAQTTSDCPRRMSPAAKTPLFDEW